MRSRRLFVAGLVVVALVLSASLLAGFQFYKTTVADRHEADIDQSARQVQSELDARLAAHQRSIELWADVPAVARHGRPAQRAALLDFVEKTGFSGVSVIDADGTMTTIAADLSRQRRQNLTGRDFSNRTYFQQAMQGQTYVSEPIPAESGNYIVTISAPIRRDGEVVGTLNGAFHLSESPFFASVAGTLSQSRGVTIRSQTGEVIYARAPTPDGDLVVRNATLQETGWTVSVMESRSVIRPTIRRTTHLQVVSLLVVVIGIAGFGWWNYRRNLRQVERLLGGFDALEAREYGTQIDIGGAEEWDRIGDGFNEMSQTLEQYFTEREEHEKQIQVLDRMLRHNLRNDVTVIRGRAETIVSAATGPIADHARQIIETSDALLSMAEKERTINELLQEHPDPKPIDLGRAVERAARDVQRTYPETRIDVCCPEECLASATVHVESAITELIENAVRHTDRTPPTVTVTVTPGPSRVRIEIADEGPGIPEMERRIVTDGRRIDPLHHSKGLGLWLVYWVVSHSEGTLRIEENEPRGTVVIVDLQRPDGFDE